MLFSTIYFILTGDDTGAYCTGMLFGKHKLFERISPKKSWEGSIGGSVFCIISSFILAHFFPFMSTGVWIGLALTVVIFGTWGDLTESLLKRRLGIKDSGNYFAGTWWNARSFRQRNPRYPCSSSLFVCSFFILIPPDPKD